MFKLLQHVNGLCSRCFSRCGIVDSLRLRDEGEASPGGIDFLLSCDEFLHSLMLIAESFTTHKGKKITISELQPSQVLCHGF